MRLGKWGLSLVVAIVLVGSGVTAVHLVMHGLGSDLGGFFDSLSVLERETAVSERLEEAFRKTVERATEKNTVLQDLVARRCTFPEAVHRYRNLCRSGDMLSFRSVYLRRAASEQEIVAHHLLVLIDRETKAHPSLRAEVLDRLEKEAAQFCATNPKAEDA